VGYAPVKSQDAFGRSAREGVNIGKFTAYDAEDGQGAGFGGIFEHKGRKSPGNKVGDHIYGVFLPCLFRLEKAL
jgi:hypothetical protein